MPFGFAGTVTSSGAALKLVRATAGRWQRNAHPDQRRNRIKLPNYINLLMQ
jgi:hypothetical protein